MPGVFISYSRRDRDFVQRLHDAFTAREYDVWVDLEDIPPSAQWLEEIHAGILGADGIVFVISPDSVVSEICIKEIEHAAERNKRIVPVVHREPAGARVPELIAALNWVFMRDGDDFDAGVDTIVRALETDLDHVRTHTRLGVEAERWEASGRDSSQLLRGTELKDAEAWLVGAGLKQPEATPLQRDFLVVSRQAATRRQRSLFAGVTVALAVAIVLAVIAVFKAVEANNANHAKTAQLDDSNALADYTFNPQQSVAHAVAAAGITQSSTTEEALRGALAQSQLRTAFVFPGATDPPDALWSPDGTRLLVTSPGRSAKIYWPGTNRRPVALPPPPTFGVVAWDARGDRVAIGGSPGGVYDAATGRRLARIPGVSLHVALSSDGSRVATTDLRGIGHVYVVATGRQAATFTPKLRGLVTCFAWAPDGSVIAQCDLQSSGGSTGAGNIDVWNASTGALLHANPTPEPVATVAFSPDSSRYVYTTTGTAPPSTGKSVSQQLSAEEHAAGEPGTFVDETRSGAQVIALAGSASAAVFGPQDSNELAYATLDNDLGHVYNFTSKLDQPLAGAQAAIEAINFNSTGTDVVLGSDDGTARVFDAGSGKQLELLADGITTRVRSASFGLGDTAIATSSQDGEARLWASPNPRPAAQAPLAGGTAAPASVGFTPDGRTIVEAGLNGAGEIVDARTLRTLARFTAPAGYEIVSAGESRNGRTGAAIATRVSAGRLNGLAFTFDPLSGRRLATFAPPAGTTLASANLNPAGTRVVTVESDGDAQQWDARSGRQLQSLPATTPGIEAAYSPDGSILAIVHDPVIPARITYTTVLGPVTIDLWSARTGHLLRRLSTATFDGALTPLTPASHVFGPLTFAFSANSKAIALAGVNDQDVYAWGTRRGAPIEPLAIPNGDQPTSVAFSHDGHMIAAGTAAGAYVWKIAGSRPSPLPEFQHADPSQFSIGLGYGVQVGFTRDSRILVTAGDWALEGWDIQDHLRLFDTYIGPYGHGTLDPGGTTFVTAIGRQLSEFPCQLCGNLRQLLSVATHRVTRIVTPG